MSYRDLLNAAERQLRVEAAEVAADFHAAIQLVRLAREALIAGDGALASRLLTEACDAEVELTGDSLATGDLFEALGLDDGAATALESDPDEP